MQNKAFGRKRKEIRLCSSKNSSECSVDGSDDDGTEEKQVTNRDAECRIVERASRHARVVIETLERDGRREAGDVRRSGFRHCWNLGRPVRAPLRPEKHGQPVSGAYRFAIDFADRTEPTDVISGRACAAATSTTKWRPDGGGGRSGAALRPNPASTTEWVFSRCRHGRY